MSTVYLKGDPGFMPAVITRLGRDAIHNGHDIAEGIVSFSLPEHVSMEEFKASVGKDIVSDFNILFFADPPGNIQPETPLKFTPGQPFTMSIWANSDAKLTGTKPVKHAEENKL